MIVCGAGCLMPQDISPTSASSHPVPRIQLASLPPQETVPEIALLRQGVNDVSTQCHCVLQLQIPVVEMDDPLVDLEARWFVDYDLSKPTSVRPVRRQPLPGSFDPTVLTRMNVSFTFEPGDYGDGAHTVEVVIGDVAGFDDASTTLPNRALKPGYEPAQYRFFVQVTEGPVSQPAQCPAVPPIIQRVGSSCP